MTHFLINSNPSRGAYAGPPLPPMTFAGFSLAIVAVVLIAYFSFQSEKNRTAAAGGVTQTIDVLEQLRLVLSGLKDAETGQRGYLLTGGTESYLEPYTNAKAALADEFAKAQTLMAVDPEQLQRLGHLRELSRQKMDELDQTIALVRAGHTDQAMALVRTDKGKLLMDGIRSLVGELEGAERDRLATRQSHWRDAALLASEITWGGSAILLVLIGSAAALVSRDYRARQLASWLRAGQMGLSERTQGDQPLDKLGEQVLGFLVNYLDAQVAAIYIAEEGDRFRRFAGVALAPEIRNDVVTQGEGLLGRAVKENRSMHVRDVPADYLPIVSGVGRGAAREILVAPASIDGVVHAVMEFGFFRTAESEQLELLNRVSESVGLAVRSSKDRTRLEELLEETQRQAEELQTQQEELRVNNEELEEQGRALKESQFNLQAQQAELEQTNSQLEEQTQLLEHQKDLLSERQLALTDKASELERANQYKSEFLANMSHELRTPLNSTLILAKLLADNKDGNLTAQQVKFAQTITSAGNDLLALINDVLDLSRIEAGKIDLAPEMVPVAGVVDSLIKIFQPAAHQNNLRFATVIEPGTPEEIETDPQRLGQILKNLLSNALKFTQKGEVSLRVSPGPDERTIAFAVRDTGVGIAAHQQSVIFEAFRQADGSIHRKFGGTGLGLSISRDLARLLGGSIRVHSEVGEGSVFTFIVPIAFDVAQPGTQSTADLSHHKRGDSRATSEQTADFELRPTEIDDDRARLTPGGKRILVIEDDAAFAAILLDLVHEMGFQCIVTETAGDGLIAAARFAPSAILLDINLPDQSGLGVLDQLKRNPKTRHVPVHVASVADYSREALELGAIGYALKPAKREQLVGALQRLEAKFSQGIRRVLIVEDDARQRDSIRELLSNGDVQITTVKSAGEALEQLRAVTFDCVVMDLNLPDYSGYELLEQMAKQEDVSFPPVIVYTGRSLTGDEEQHLRRFSKSIIIKDARSPERLLDEVTLFLHQVESSLPIERQRMLSIARNRDASLDGRRILVVEDDVRNIFALSSVLEPKGAKLEIARNGREALEALARSTSPGAGAIDLVLMDIMMPEMDGLTAMREIRKEPQWKKLPIIALTAKAMKDDQDKCLAAGANDYIAKPLDVEKLLSLVRVWMPK